ncbi:TonB-dependent siderophore receptor [Chitinilyticum litopenaei]|uniref:TonB-dependent siderophore receptor n=1 Tax=Chitinilyticum litopenaei TaxID=1121276 RepID=UPI0003FF25DA|nr:TonB-dependent siderophore receptor [Chitinilyticum litopenaei]
MKAAGFVRTPLARALWLAGLSLAGAMAHASDAVILPEVDVVAGDAARAPANASNWSAGDSRVATKTTTTLGELAQSVSVVTRAQIEAQMPSTIVEALNYSPGAYAGLFGNATRYDYVALRGFVDTSMANTVLDGLRLMSDAGSFSAFAVDPYFVERVELVRGPISVLYGNAAPGGMVALTSKQPQHARHSEVRVDVGSDAQRALAFDLAGGLSDTVSVRLTGIGKQGDSMQDYAEEKRLAIMPQLLWQPDKDTALLLQAYLQNDPEGGFHSGTPYEGSVSEHAGRKIRREFFDGEPDHDQFDRSQRMLGYQFAHRFTPAWEVRQNLRYTSSDMDLEQFYQAGWADDSELYRGYSFSEEKLKGLAVDTRLQGAVMTGDWLHELVLGIDYQDRKNEGFWGWGTVGNIDAFNPVYGNDAISDTARMNWVRKFRQTGFYLQDQIALGGWRFTAGARYDRANTSVHDPDAGTTTTWSGGEWSRRLGVLYRFDNGIAPYLSYSESFDPSSNTDIDGQVLRPTRGRQLEGGVKYQPHAGLLLTAALYDLDQEHVARMVPGASHFEPVGTVQSRGLELEAVLDLGKYVTLHAAYTRNDMEIRNGADGSEGKRPRQSPEQLASAWLNLTPAAGTRLGLGVRHIGKSWADIANTMAVPSTTLFDLSASVELGKWIEGMKGVSLQLSANNLFDKDYVAACYGENYCYFGEGRSVMTSLKYVW